MIHRSSVRRPPEPTIHRAEVDPAVLAFAHFVENHGVMSIQEVHYSALCRQLAISQSTFFRRYRSKHDFALFCYDECWRDLNSDLARASFVPAQSHCLSPEQNLERDFQRLAARFFSTDPDVRALTTCAVFMYRRTDQLRLDQEVPSQANLLEERITSWCRLSEWKEPEVVARNLVAFFVSCWIYWSMNRDDAELLANAQDEFGKRLRLKLDRHMRDAADEYDTTSTPSTPLARRPK